MSKKLSEMTLEELWQLFPIFLVEPKPQWAEWYAEEAERIKSVLPAGLAARISHIGSTAIPDIWAKAIIDILLEVNSAKEMEEAARLFVQNGYIVMSREDKRISLNSGYTEQGFAERVFHLHLRLTGDCDELYFRDYLREHKAVASEYEKLKLSLWKQYEHDRDGYTDAKTDFIKNVTITAKQLYPNRY